MFCSGYCSFFVTFLSGLWPHNFGIGITSKENIFFLLVGGTMNRLLKLDSLKMPLENQILTPWDMYEWVDKNIENIKFFYVSTEDTASHTSINRNRLTTAETIDSTRSYHCFRPNGETKLELYSLSVYEIFVVILDNDCLKNSHFVAAVYEGQWYLKRRLTGIKETC